jgi:general secretion pathway protein L
MSTCFIFFQSLADETYLSVRVDEHGHVDAALDYRTLEAVKVLQDKAHTIIVLPTEMSTLHYVELPWLSDRKARLALPFALEEMVAQKVSELHIAFSKQYYQNEQYLVVVIDKTFLSMVMARFDELGLCFDAITLDWFALQDAPVCVTETGLLVSDASFQGALSGDVAALYLESQTDLSSIVRFDDSAPTLILPSFHCVSGSFYEWVAKRLAKIKPMTLCQGDLQHRQRGASVARWYHVSLGLLGLWLACIVVMDTVLSYRLSHQLSEVDRHISVIYHEFFPQATQVISPKFRVEQWLHAAGAHQDETFWRLLNALAQAGNHHAFTIQHLRYEHNMLSVSLISPDFEALETLERRLQQASITVTQTQASSQKQHVMATLELR